MSTGLTLTLSILFGLSVLFAALGLIFSRIRKKLDRLVAAKFDPFRSLTPPAFT